MTQVTRTEKLKQELQTLRDEAKVKLHLAGMEAKNAWNELEPELEALIEKAKTAGSEASAELEKRATEAQTKAKNWLEKVRK